MTFLEFMCPNKFYKMLQVIFFLFIFLTIYVHIIKVNRKTSERASPSLKYKNTIIILVVCRKVYFWKERNRGWYTEKGGGEGFKLVNLFIAVKVS